MEKSEKKFKEHKDAAINEIHALRRQLEELAPEKKEEAGAACKGMYQCSREQTEGCLDGIKAKLKEMIANEKKKKKGGGKRSRSRSKSKSRSGGKARSRSRSKSKSKSRKR
jgi:hypothetical protein